MSGSISLAAVCLIVLIIAVMRVGVVWTLAIAICSTAFGIVATLAGITGTIAQAINTAASAFGKG